MRKGSKSRRALASGLSLAYGGASLLLGAKVAAAAHCGGEAERMGRGGVRIVEVLWEIEKEGARASSLTRVEHVRLDLFPLSPFRPRDIPTRQQSSATVFHVEEARALNSSGKEQRSKDEARG